MPARAVVWLLALVLMTGSVRAEQPALTPEQKEQLKEAKRLTRQVLTLLQKGEFTEAIPLAEKVKETRESILGKEHLDTAESLNNLAYLYHRTDAGPKADPLFRQAVAIYNQMVDDPARFRTLNKLAWIYHAANLSVLATAYREVGSFAQAEPLLHLALQIYKQTLGEENDVYAAGLNALGLMHWAMGDYAQAERFHRRALQIRKKTVGEKNPNYADSLNNLGLVYIALRDFNRAEPLYRQALEITRQAQGEKSVAYAVRLNNLGLLYESKGDFAQAEALYRQALEIRKQAGAANGRETATTLNNLALMCRARGDYAGALPLFRQALEIRKQTVGDRHPDYAATLRDLGVCLIAAKQVAEGEPLVFRSAEIARRSLEETAEVESETQQLASAKKYNHYLCGLLYLAAESPAPTDKAYDEILLWKGAVAGRQNAIRRFRADLERTGNRELIAVYDELLAATRRLANLLGRPPAPKQADDYRKSVQETSDRIERLEQKLAAASAEFRQERERRHRASADLRRALSPNAAFIDFVEYCHFLPESQRKKQNKKWYERRLTAFIVRPGYPVARVNLGPAEEINQAVARWRKAFGDDDTGTAMRRLVWEPLAKHLDGTNAVLVSPDGALTRFPFAALPGSRPGSYLIEDLAVGVVTVPQQLPELLAPVAKPADPSLLVVGGVNYGGEPGQAIAGLSRDAAQLRDSRLSWTNLPATGPEAQAVREQFQRLFPKGPINDLRGDDATEEAVRHLAQRCRYLHFATHGYYDPPGLRSALTEAAQPDIRGLGVNSGGIAWHPGLLCGLVLTGANRPPALDHDDGILTALELGAFDLTGVELAVLSACETAQGESTAGGEGLLGLQRAFQTAGARCVVASLWSVDDRATRRLMTQFYENLWAKKMGRLEALRQAQLSLLHGQEDASGTRGLETAEEPVTPGRVHPRLWAAWVLSGAPGDLSKVRPAEKQTGSPVAAAESTPKTLSPWLLIGLGAALAAAWSAWRLFRQRASRLDFNTAANDSWARSLPEIRGLPGSETLCERVAKGKPPWPTIAFAMSNCSGFPSAEFAELLASGDFDVRWPLTFAAWHWGASGSSVDQACADFLSCNGLWERALEVLPEYNGREWLPGWRANFEEYHRT